MATGQDLRRAALALDGVTEAPHFDRVAFKAKRIFATLPSEGGTANLRLSPDEQALKCVVAPDAFAPVPNAWGKQGWTIVQLARLSDAELAAALLMAWRHAAPRPKGSSPRRPSTDEAH